MLTGVGRPSGDGLICYIIRYIIHHQPDICEALPLLMTPHLAAIQPAAYLGVQMK